MISFQTWLMAVHADLYHRAETPDDVAMFIRSVLGSTWAEQLEELYHEGDTPESVVEWLFEREADNAYEDSQDVADPWELDYLRKSQG